MLESFSGIEIPVLTISDQQSGAEEACWAHNPEVGGSKPLSAIYIFFVFCDMLNTKNVKAMTCSCVSSSYRATVRKITFLPTMDILS